MSNDDTYTRHDEEAVADWWTSADGTDPLDDNIYLDALDSTSPSTRTRTRRAPAHRAPENPYNKAGVEPLRKPMLKKRPRRIVIGILSAIFLLIAGYSLLMYSSITMLRHEGSSAIAGVNALRKDMKSQNATAAAKHVEEMATAISNMRAEVDGPLWTTANFIPFLGTDVANGRELLHIADDFVQTAIVPRASELASIPLQDVFDDGSVHTDALVKTCGFLGTISPDVITANERASVLRPGLVGPLNEGLETVQSILKPLAILSTHSDMLQGHLPRMLGADGTSANYLILAETNSELRSAGGFPGSWGLLTIEDGKVELGEFSSPQNVRQKVDSTEEEKFIYGTKNLDMVTSVSINPNFPRVAEVVTQMYTMERESKGESYVDISGVIAVDPIFLQDVLKITGGSVDMYGNYVDGNNAAEMILSRIYWEVKPKYHDAIFAAVAQQTFTSLMYGLDANTLTDVLKAAEDGAAHRNITMWFADAEEQELIHLLGMTGAVSNDPVRPRIGVYLNDYTWSKMDWYLSCDTRIDGPSMTPGQPPTYRITTHIENHMTPQQAKDAPKYVTGGKLVDNERIKEVGDTITYVLLYGPPGGVLTNLEFSDDSKVLESGFQYGSVDDLRVAVGQIYLKPTESLDIVYDVQVSEEANERLTVDTTPTAQEIAGW